MSLILLIAIFVVVLGGLRTWRHSRNWGYGPVRAFGVLLITVMVFLVLEYLPPYAASDGERILSVPGGSGTDVESVFRTVPPPSVGEDMPPAPGKPPGEPIAPSRFPQPSPPIDGGMEQEPI